MPGIAAPGRALHQVRPPRDGNARQSRLAGPGPDRDLTYSGLAPTASLPPCLPSPFSKDCPIFYMRKKVQKDLKTQDNVLARFNTTW